VRWLSIFFLFLGACAGLLGDAPDIEYDKVIVPVVTEFH
jgi:hypothetical protein